MSEGSRGGPPESADLTMITNGALVNLHPATACAGRGCWVHHPSDHHMATWPIVWRDEKGTAERRCEHGIGHPDPDDVWYHEQQGRDVGVHACDGCCVPEDDDPTDITTPNCPQCLMPMAAVERGSAVVWKCPQCGLVQTAV
jgi:hypothetical protein